MNRKNLLAVGMSMLCLFGASTMQVAASETDLIPIQGQTTEASQVETINEETDSMLSNPKDTEIDESIDDGIIEPAPDLPESEPSEEETPPADVPTIANAGNVVTMYQQRKNQGAFITTIAHNTMDESIKINW